MGEYGVYHVFNKSIAGYTIFNAAEEYERMLMLLRYYQQKAPPMKFSSYWELMKGKGVPMVYENLENEDRLARIISYCLMPTHIHLLLEPLQEDGIAVFTGNVLNSYTRYFNLRHKRKGPLWVGRSKKVLVADDGALLHMTRYIHLNPVTAYLTDNPGSWKYSSYQEYLKTEGPGRICDFKDYIDRDAGDYKEFVEDRIGYQRELAGIKNLVLEETSSTA